MARNAEQEVSVDRDDDVWLVTLSGEFDLASVPELRSTLDSLIGPENASSSRPTLVVLDMSETTFVTVP